MTPEDRARRAVREIVIELTSVAMTKARVEGRGPPGEKYIHEFLTLPAVQDKIAEIIAREMTTR